MELDKALVTLAPDTGATQKQTDLIRLKDLMKKHVYVKSFGCQMNELDAGEPCDRFGDLNQVALRW